MFQQNKNEKINEKNLTTKRPNTGQIPAKDFYSIINKRAKKNISKNKQLSYSDVIWREKFYLLLKEEQIIQNYAQ